MVEIIAFANQKGGVGKTTTAINIGTSLAAIKKRVLLVDLDPQCNASTGLGFVRNSHPQSVYNVIMGISPVTDNVLSTAVQNMHIIPASMDLANAELDLLDTQEPVFRLKNALAPIYDYYDYILFDCPPALGFLTINALTASDSVIVPSQCEFYSLEGLTQLQNSIGQVKAKYNPKLNILGILLTMYDKRYTVTRAVENELRDAFGDTVFQTVVPRNIRVSEAPSHGKPALLYDFNSTGAQAYLKVATEIIERTQKGN